MQSSPFIEYTPVESPHHPPRYLVELVDEERGRSFVFYDGLEIGRYDAGQTGRPGTLRIQDPTVSSRHCLIRLEADGRCTLRDVSRNGVRIDGQRIVPGQETSLEIGNVITLGANLRFRLEGNPAAVPLKQTGFVPGTAVTTDVTVCTLLVGDIRSFTRLTQNTLSPVVQDSITRVFARLEEEVARHGGTVKEYQGDAIVAFWEPGPRRDSAVRACRAALALHGLAGELAGDPEVWNVPGFPLQFDWALATGPVSFKSVGGANPMGLSIVGESVVLAFRLEKLADNDNGPILACPNTRQLAEKSFPFHSLGKRAIKGFNNPVEVFALELED